MNYERFKKVIVSLALIFVFAFSTIVTSVTPVSAQGYYPRRYWGQQYYRPAYRYPYQGQYYYPGQYNRYGYRMYNPYYNYQYYNQYRYHYPYGYGYGSRRWIY